MILVGACFMVGVNQAIAQVSTKGLSPPANTFRSYQDASIVRDSGLNQPLDLLNDFYPAIEVTVTDHDNVRRRPDFDESDLKIVASPSLAYRTNLGRHKFYAAYNGVYTFHQDIEQEDAEANTFIANAGLDLSRRWDINLFGGFGDTFEERGISGGREFSRFANNGINSGPEEVEYRSYGADLIFGRKIGVLTGVLGFEHFEAEFKSDNLPPLEAASDRDREIDSVHLDVNWQFASRTSVFGRVQKSDVDYNSDTNTLDSEQTDYLLGLRLKPLNALSGVVGVGYSEKEFDDPSREDYDGATYYANLSYTLQPFSVLELGVSRAVEEPSGEDASYYESDYFGVGLSHGFTDRLTFDAFAKWIDDEYENGRRDDFFDWGVGLDYVWKNWMTAGIYYGEIERESTRQLVGYDDSYFGIRLRSDLRSLFRGNRNRETEPGSFDYPKRTQPTQ